MTSVLCGRPTPTGPCRRPVAAPGAPCGAAHTATVSPTGAPPTGTFQAGPDPLLPNADPDAGAASQVLAVSLGHLNWQQRFAAAYDPLTHPDVLAHLATESDHKVRYIVAARTDDPALLARLAADPDQWVAEEALLNRRCPAAALDLAASHPNPRIADTAAAGAISTPPDRLAALATDPSWRVRQRIAGRADLPAGVLAGLANDEDGFVAAAARANPAFTGAEAAHAGLLAD